MQSPCHFTYNWTFISSFIEGSLRWLLYLLTRYGRPYRSQCGQDAFIHQRFFSGKKGGCFVDIGANDGITGSNTYFFETELGWGGLCVEPLPSAFAKLRQNRVCSLFHGCVSDVAETEDFLEISGSLNMCSGIIRKYDPRHARFVRRILFLERSKTVVIKVQCRLRSPLSSSGCCRRALTTCAQW